jgi:hypothetical protein
MRRTPLWIALSLAATLVTPGALFAACSSSSAGPPASSDAGDAASDVAISEAAVDAGPDIQQDPNVYPSQHEPIPLIDYNGGAILKHIRVVTITFTGDTRRDSLRAFDHFVTSSTWWKETAEGYCVDGGPCVGDGTAVATDGGAWIPDGSTDDAGDGYLDVELPFDFPTQGDSGLASVDDSAIGPWLGHHIAAGDFPAPDDQTVYAVYFTSNATITLMNSASCIGFGAYHSSAVVTSGSSQQVAYAVIPACDYGLGATGNFNYVTLSASHELAEAATDPHPLADTAFYLRSNDAWLGALSYGGGECGDMCTYLADPTYDESNYTVQRIWSNSAAAASKNPCQPWDMPYFGAAVRTQLLDVGGHKSHGYVVVKRGQSVDAIADVFSEAALPADFLLYVGIDKGHAPGSGVTDPSDVGSLAPVTVQLSQQQVHNGDGVIITFTAPSNAPVGETRVVVRSVLTAGQQPQFNDWPIILRVE